MTEKPHSGSNLIITGAISSLAFASNLVASIALARFLGVEGRGIFSLFQTTVFGLIVFADFGIGQGQLFHSSTQPDNLRFVLPNSNRLALLLGGGVAVLYVLSGKWWHWSVVLLLDNTSLVIAILVTPIMLLLIYQRQFLLSIHAYKLSKANAALAAILPLFAYLIASALGYANPLGFMFAFAASQLACVFLFGWLLTSMAPNNCRPSFKFAKKSFFFGIRSYLAESIQYMALRLDFFLVAALLGKHELGYYAVAVSFTEIVPRIAREIGTALFSAFASGEVPAERVTAMLRKTFLLALMGALALGIAGQPLIALVFGHRFEPALPAFRMLLIGMVPWSTVSLTWSRVAASGRPELGIPVFAAATCLDAILVGVLVPRFGLVAAGAAAAASYWVAALLFLWIFCKQERCSFKKALLVDSQDVRSLAVAFYRVPRLLLHRLV